MVKPDGVQRGMVGDILTRFEKKGFKLVGLKMSQPGSDHFEKHYEEHKGRPFFPGLVSFASSGPVVGMVWEGNNAVATGRKMLGMTKPEDSAPGTIRGDLCVDMKRNIVHGSDSVESANREVGLWFKDEEICNWKHHSEEWKYEK